MVKKILALILASITCLSVTACAPTIPPEKPTYASNKSMPILSYLPPAETAEKLRDYKEAGFTVYLMHSRWDNKYLNSQKFLDDLALIESFGLDAYMRTMDQACFGSDRRFLDDVNVNFNDHDSIKALYFWDEPNGAMIEEISNKLVDWWNETYAEEKIFFTNLYPSYASEAQLGISKDEYVDGSAWLGYVNKHINEVLKRVNGRKVLSCDHYPLGHSMSQNKDTLSQTWLTDYATLAHLVKGIENCDLNLYIQSYGVQGGAKIPDCVGDIALQVYTCLALGADSLDFYNYAGAPGEYALEYNGEKTPMYNYVKKTLNDFHAWENVYLNFEWNGVKCYYGTETAVDGTFSGMTTLSLDSLPGVKQVGARLNTVIGHFTDMQDRNGYMVINFTIPSEERIDVVDLTFEGDYTKALIYNEGQEQEIDLIDGTARVTLNPGQGAFVIPY